MFRRVFGTATGSKFFRYYMPRLAAYSNTTSGVLLAVNVLETKQCKIEEQHDFRPDFFIKLASSNTVDTACVLINQISATLLDTIDQYIKEMETLIRLMELNLDVLGSSEREDLVWDNMLAIRAKVAECKERKVIFRSQADKQNLEVLFSIAEKTLNSATEAAYLAGSDYHGTVGGDCLRLAQSKVQEELRKSSEMELKVKQMDVKSIEGTVEHSRNQEQAEIKSDSESAELQQHVEADNK